MGDAGVAAASALVRCRKAQIPANPRYRGSFSQRQHENRSVVWLCRLMGAFHRGSIRTKAEQNKEMQLQRLLGLEDVEEPLFQGVYVDCAVVL